MSAQPHGPFDPEVEMQEHGSWFTDLVLWCFSALAYVPVILFGLFAALMIVTACAIIVLHFTR